MGTFVICWGECSKFLLSCCIPDLKWIYFVVDGSGIGFEVDADGGEVVIVEFGLAESEEYGAFSYCLWSYNDDFEGSGFDIALCFVHIWWFDIISKWKEDLMQIWIMNIRCIFFCLAWIWIFRVWGVVYRDFKGIVMILFCTFSGEMGNSCDLILILSGKLINFFFVFWILYVVCCYFFLVLIYLILTLKNGILIWRLMNSWRSCHWDFMSNLYLYFCN